MPEMSHAGEHHGNAVLIGGLDHFFVVGWILLLRVKAPPVGG